jgi:hypothetical protein
MAWTERYVTADSDGGDGSSGNPWTLAEAIAGATAGDRVNVKAGTYANTTTSRDFAVDGTATAPIWWRGYKTTIGDQDAVATASAGTDIPLITFSTGQLIVSGANNIFSNIAVTSACVTTGGAFYITDVYVCLYRLRIANSASNAAARALGIAASGDYVHVVACHLSSNAAANVVATYGGLYLTMYGCYIGGGLNGILVGDNSGSFHIEHTIFDSQADDAMEVLSGGHIGNCSIYAPAGNGINITAVMPVHISNCYFENVNQASKAGINQTSGTDTNMIVCVNNAFYNCTATYDGITENFVIYDKGTLASAGFNDPANDDFTTKAIGRAIGFPGAFENLASTVGYLDLGAVQHADPTGGVGQLINGGLIK